MSIQNENKFIFPSNYIKIAADSISQTSEKTSLPCDADNASKQSNKAESESEQTIPSKKRKKEDSLTLSCLSPSMKKPKVPYVPQKLTQKEEKNIDDVITDVLKKYSNKSDQAETENSMTLKSKLNVSSSSDKFNSSETDLVSPKHKEAKKESKLTPVKPVIAENTASSKKTVVNLSGDLNLSLKDDEEKEKLSKTNGSPKKKLKKKSKKKASSSPTKTNNLVGSNCIAEQTEEQSSIKSQKKAKKTKSKIESDKVATKVGDLASEKLNESDYEFDIDKELIPKATKSKNKELKKQNQDTDSGKKKSENEEKTSSEEFYAKKEKKKKKKAKQNKE